MYTIDDFDVGVVGRREHVYWLRNMNVLHISQRAFDNGDVIVVYFCPGKRMAWMAKRGLGIILPPTRLPVDERTDISSYCLAVCMRGQTAAARVEHIVTDDLHPGLLMPRGVSTPRSVDDYLRHVVYFQEEAPSDDEE